MYLFSIIGHLSVHRLYDIDGDGSGYMDGSTLFLTFTSTLNYGLRLSGGIGEAMIYPTKDDKLFYKFLAFSLLFYIVINILIINVLFGTILHTFGELRMKA